VEYNEMLAQTVYFGFMIGEIKLSDERFQGRVPDQFPRIVKYGFGVLDARRRSWDGSKKG
jgi:hypothetical protein